MLVSIIRDHYLSYPENIEYFSPSEHYPEYPFTHIASRYNPIYKAVRESLAQAGLDVQRFGTSEWNPFRNIIKEKDNVFILCNFVYHKRIQESANDFYAKCTHASVLRPLIDYIYIAVRPKGRISFGNAPLQSCRWEQVLEDTGAFKLLEFYKLNSADISAKDLRLMVSPRSSSGSVKYSKQTQDDSGIEVSLDAASLLDELYLASDKVKFRVSDYNPDRTARFHQYKRHTYVINKEILSSDVIFSAPKLKTHEKVGISIGLKGLVGCVGHKDCLAHHRFGPPKLQGDEYPDNGRVQVLLSLFHDFVYRRRYPKFVSPFLEIVDSNSRRVAGRVFKKIQAGAWYGNDTAWRMAIDLAYILNYADKNGNLTDKLQRKHFMLVDGILGGEGNGPLAPKAVESKAIIFSDHIVHGDAVACRMMGFDPERIPMIRHSLRDPRLVEQPQAGSGTCIMNGENVPFDKLSLLLGRPFLPPAGWKGFIS